MWIYWWTAASTGRDCQRLKGHVIFKMASLSTQLTISSSKLCISPNNDLDGPERGTARTGGPAGRLSGAFNYHSRLPFPRTETTMALKCKTLILVKRNVSGGMPANLHSGGTLILLFKDLQIAYRGIWYLIRWKSAPRYGGWAHKSASCQMIGWTAAI